MHTGDLLAELLIAHGVEHVFGMTGSQGYPLNDALHRRRPKIRHIMVRDERSSAYAADGYARVSGKVGVCDAALGVGALKLPSGVAEAYNSSIPILAILSNAPRDWSLWIDRGCTAQGVEQLRPFELMSKAVVRVPSQETLPSALRYSFRIASSGRPGPVVLDIPADIFHQEYRAATGDSVCNPTNGRFPSSRPHPDPAEVTTVVQVLRAAERPVLVAGGGVALSRASHALVRLAEALQIPVATTVSGKGVFPEDHPLSIGILGGQYGSDSANAVVDEADVVFFVGAKSSQQVTAAWTRPSRSQRLVHLDVDPTEIGKIFPTEAGVVADARAGLEALHAGLSGFQFSGRQWLPRVRELRARWEAEIAEEMRNKTAPIKPQFLMAELQKHLDPGDIVVSDASFSIGWVVSYLRAIRDGQRFLFPRGSATLGFGLPAAIGARFAQTDGKVLLLVGDGGITYSIGEMSTLVKYGLDMVVIVLNNGCLAYSKFSERLGYHGDYESVDFPDTDFAAIARGFGCSGLSVKDPDELAEALAVAFKTGGPVVVDVRVDELQTPELALRKHLKALGGQVMAKSGDIPS